MPDTVHKTSCGGDWWQLGSYDPGAPRSVGSFKPTPGWEEARLRAASGPARGDSPVDSWLVVNRTSLRRSGSTRATFTRPRTTSTRRSPAGSGESATAARHTLPGGHGEPSALPAQADQLGVGDGSSSVGPDSAS